MMPPPAAALRLPSAPPLTAEPVLPRAAGLLIAACIALAPRECAERSAPNLAADLGAAVAGDPPGGPRLSIPTRPCPDSGCLAAPAPPGVLRVARQASIALADSARADALHASALVDLVWGRGGIPLDRSIQSLRTASRLAASPAPILADLAAALLVRAERTGSARDQFEALDAAEEALRLAPDDAAARFNAALAADRLGLAEAADSGWRAAAAAPASGSDAAWARLASRERGHPPRRPPGPDRQKLRELGWDRLLGEWGASTLRGDSAAAVRALARADSAGRELQAAGGDASLADAVRAIGLAAESRDATLRLARGHAAYAHAWTAFEASRWAEAADSLAAVASLRPGDSPLHGWAGVLRAASTAYQRGRSEAAERELDAWAAGMDTLRHPALAGRSAWVRATIHLRTGRYESSRGWARVAERHLARAGERENAGAARAVAADAAFALGDAEEVYSDARRALATLHPFRGSVWLHNALAAVSLRAAEDGMPGAALRLGWEDVRMAAGTGDPIHLAEAHLVRARVAMSVGRGQLARAETAAGAAALALAAPGRGRDWLRADLQLTRAFTELGADPLRASAALDSAFGHFAALSNPLRALPLLVARGEARLAGGDARGAADLERATASLAEMGRGTRDGALAATLLDAARPVFDRAVALRLARGDTVGALLALDRGRTAFGRGAGAGAPPLAPRGTTVVYGVVGDTVLTWVVGRGTARMHRQRVPRDELARSTERLRWALERGVAPVAGRELDRLARWLLHPVEPWIGPRGEVTVVTDGELASIPFAALPARSGRPWIEDHPLRRAPSLADAALPRPAGRPERALLVADPAFDAARHPGLPRLPGARREVEEAAREYARRHVLSGADATPDALLRGLRSADVVHFAGHAVWDGGSPKRSWLVLAPGSEGAGRLSAAELGAAGLEGVRLVVLSACHTVGSGEGRMGGFAGFAGSLLAGGADGVVGSLWRVDDDATRALMREFHLAYRASGDASDALRRAQLALIRSPDVRLRAPSAWAGFVYAGS